MSPTILYFDGGCIPNPGQMEYIVTDSSGNVLDHQYCGHGTNNHAEWIGLLSAFSFAVNMEGPVIICGDSQLVINQINKDWKIKLDVGKEISGIIWKTMNERNFAPIFKYVPRDKNISGNVLEKMQKSRRR